MARLLLGRLSETPPGTLKRVEHGDLSICLARADDGRVYAIGDVCTHEESSLSEGSIEGMEVECPAHSSRFDLRTGAVMCGPATKPVAGYSTEVVGDEIYVDLADAANDPEFRL